MFGVVFVDFSGYVIFHFLVIILLSHAFFYLIIIDLISIICLFLAIVYCINFLYYHYSLVFTNIPSDTTLDEGSSLLWNCAATGTPTPEIQWMRSGVVLQSGSPDRLTIFPNNSLYITDLRPQDQDTYQCRAMSEPLVVVVQAVLTVRGSYFLFCIHFNTRLSQMAPHITVADQGTVD